ncbi:MAG: HPr family phosphocarrier protein [Spartobacteria bacterium]|nr:HPr family phosphocarrier protein [Spartobacteria bacterium]
MIEKTAVIKNSDGIHCRPSAVIVKASKCYTDCQIRVLAQTGSCDPRSVLALISLALSPGTIIRIQVEGPEEERICGELVELFETHFDFPPLG